MKTYNPVMAKNQIHNIEDYNEFFLVVIMPKLDGFRCGITEAQVPNIDYNEGKYEVPDTVHAWSRNGKNLPSFFI